MIWKLIGFFILWLQILVANAQDTTRLNLLLRERAKIHQEYVFLNAQNSNFWGKKSKKDLLKIIDTLKGIIRKDSEIIREVNIESLKRQALITVEKERIQNQVIDDKQIVNDNFYDLKSQLNSLQNLQKVKQKELNSATEKINVLQNSRNKYDLMLALCVLTILGLLYYIFKLQGRLSKKKR